MVLDVNIIPAGALLILLRIIWPSWNGGSISVINLVNFGHCYFKYSFHFTFSFPPFINFMDVMFLGSYFPEFSDSSVFLSFSSALEVSSAVFSSVVLSTSGVRWSRPGILPFKCWSLCKSLPSSLAFPLCSLSSLPAHTPTSRLLFSVSALSTLVVRIVFNFYCNDLKTYTMPILAPNGF